MITRWMWTTRVLTRRSQRTMRIQPRRGTPAAARTQAAICRSSRGFLFTYLLQLAPNLRKPANFREFFSCCTPQLCVFARYAASSKGDADSRTHCRPRKYREDMVSAFVEMLAWAFSCRLEQATIQPKLQLHGVTFPLPHIASVYRTPKDARKARSGILEGPLLAVSCRDQTRFRGPNQEEGEGPFEIMDLLRETGLMAMLAQKRARDGKEEKQPGAGKWWTTTPRWGGGPGGECGIAEEEAMEEPVQDASGPQRKRAKRSTKADVWRAMQPPKSTWEKGIHYQQIGKDKKSLYDDVSRVADPFPLSPAVLQHTDRYPTPDLSHILRQPPSLHPTPPHPRQVRRIPLRRQGNPQRLATAVVRAEDAAFEVVRSAQRR